MPATPASAGVSQSGYVPGLLGPVDVTSSTSAHGAEIPSRQSSASLFESMTFEMGGALPTSTPYTELDTVPDAEEDVNWGQAGEWLNFLPAAQPEWTPPPEPSPSLDSLSSMHFAASSSSSSINSSGLSFGFGGPSNVYPQHIEVSHGLSFEEYQQQAPSRQQSIVSECVDGTSDY